MTTSKFFKLNLRDIGKGLLSAIIGSVLGGITQMVSTGGDITKIDLHQVGGWALIAGSAYLTKNLFTNSNDEFGKFETPKIDTDKPNVK